MVVRERDLSTLVPYTLLVQLFNGLHLGECKAKARIPETAKGGERGTWEEVFIREGVLSLFFRFGHIPDTLHFRSLLKYR